MKIVLDIQSKDQLDAVWSAYYDTDSYIKLKFYESMKIEELGLTMRSLNCLKSENIFTVGELLKWSYEELIKTPLLGRKSLNEIVAVLEIRGLSLKKGT